jgi:hypothetical protein
MGRAGAARGQARVPGRTARASDAVAQALQHYADRGVFRGFSVKTERRGRLDFSFTWLTRRPTLLTYDPKKRVLSFRNLLPSVGRDRALVSKLKTIVDSHMTATVPSHRRIDARRTRAECSVRSGHLTLTLKIRGAHHTYAVQRGVNLVNQLFLLLHEGYPEYLIEHFGLQAE